MSTSHDICHPTSLVRPTPHPPPACTRLNALELSEAQQSQLDLGRLAALAALLEQLTSEPEITAEVTTVAAYSEIVGPETELTAPAAP